MSQTTKYALAASLKKLLAEKSLDKITVTDIAEDCQVNRQTFYYHFKDIYDLLEWIYLNEVSALLGGGVTYDTWQEALLHIFRYALDNRTLILRTYRSIRRDYLEQAFYRLSHTLLISIVEECAAQCPVRREDKEFLVRFYQYALGGLLLDWIGGGMKEDPQKIIDRLNVLLHGSIPIALERFRTGGASGSQPH